MALTELQQPNKEAFYSDIRSIGNRLYDSLNRDIIKTSEFLAEMDAATLDAMNVPAAGTDNGLRVDLVNFRIALQELRAFWQGTSTTQTIIPMDAINKIRGM